MSNKYAAAMSTQNGEWDFDRDVAFAMDSLLPWIKELLSYGDRPSPSSFKDFRWIEIEAPGVYACLAVKKDSAGNILSSILKVGCAWSVDGGLRARKWEHLNDKLSKEYADTGNPTIAATVLLLSFDVSVKMSPAGLGVLSPLPTSLFRANDVQRGWHMNLSSVLNLALVRGVLVCVNGMGVLETACSACESSGLMLLFVLDQQDGMVLVAAARVDALGATLLFEWLGNCHTSSM
ncbi:hypothetical protein KCU67_g15861, partial [Aureobasidium melanogenum]